LPQEQSKPLALQGLQPTQQSEETFGEQGLTVGNGMTRIPKLPT
jgi:hypothetical protein